MITGNRQQVTDNRQQATGSKQQATGITAHILGSSLWGTSWGEMARARTARSPARPLFALEIFNAEIRYRESSLPDLGAKDFLLPGIVAIGLRCEGFPATWNRRYRNSVRRISCYRESSLPEFGAKDFLLPGIVATGIRCEGFLATGNRPFPAHCNYRFRHYRKTGNRNRVKRNL